MTESRGSHKGTGNGFGMIETRAKADKWQVYLLKCGDGTLYCGITSDLNTRIKEHNDGTGAKYTRGRGPLTLVAATPLMSKSDALRLEIKIKKQPAAKKVPMLKKQAYNR